MLYEELTDKIIRCYYDVYNELGYGFLEKVYERAMLIRLKEEGLSCEPQFPVDIYFHGLSVGQYHADILVEQKVIIELKAGNTEYLPAHEYQLINYLKGSDKEVGLLLFFGKTPCIKRKVFTH